MNHPVAFWIEKLNLLPHPEGGYYREVYRSPETVEGAHLPPRFRGARSFATSIYFLLPGDRVSSLHRIKSDEMWHFYTGAPLRIAVIEPNGEAREIRMGAALEKGESFQEVVPAGAWFGASVDDATSFALVGCTVTPGFDFADFELAERGSLLAEFPQHRQIIERLTPPR